MDGRLIEAISIYLSGSVMGEEFRLRVVGPDSMDDVADSSHVPVVSRSEIGVAEDGGLLYRGAGSAIEFDRARRRWKGPALLRSRLGPRLERIVGARPVDCSVRRRRSGAAASVAGEAATLAGIACRM